jgi:SAM-dependent methyltransferase
MSEPIQEVRLPDAGPAESQPFLCRSCGRAGKNRGVGGGKAHAPEASDRLVLEPVLNLGRTPLANQLLSVPLPDEPELTYPLELVFCPRCTLLQITVTVPPEILFRDYLYFSSFSDTMLRHAERSAERLIAERALGPRSLVVEAASNDGYFLQHFARRGIPVLGIEPARNIAAVARTKGIPTVDEFFCSRISEHLRGEGRTADVFLANNVLAHVADLYDFVVGVRTLLAPRGVAVIEVPYAKDMIDHGEFDTIYHEHLCYFSLTALANLFKPHRLAVTHVERLPIHGGSLRVFVSHADGQRPDATVDELLREEKAWGVDRPAFYQGFARKVASLKTSLRDLLLGLKQSGKRLAAYGAAAKGSTLLNYMGIGRDILDFVVDRSTYKQGRYMPGVRLPIFAPAKLLEAMPDYTLLLTWNFADEILGQQAEYRRRGGRFIIPVPEPKVV